MLLMQLSHCAVSLWCSQPASQLVLHLWQVANAAHDMLSMIDAGAAQLNDKINLFKSEAKFPEVFRSPYSHIHP